MTWQPGDSHEIPATLRPVIEQADRAGRSVVTVLGDRLAIIMPIPGNSDADADQQGERLARYIRAIEAALAEEGGE